MGRPGNGSCSGAALTMATEIDWQLIDENTPRDDMILLTDGGGLWQGFWQQGVWLTGFDSSTIHVRVTLNPTHWAPYPNGPKPK